MIDSSLCKHLMNTTGSRSLTSPFCQASSYFYDQSFENLAIVALVLDILHQSELSLVQQLQNSFVLRDQLGRSRLVH